MSIASFSLNLSIQRLSEYQPSNLYPVETVTSLALGKETVLPLTIVFTLLRIVILPSEPLPASKVTFTILFVSSFGFSELPLFLLTFNSMGFPLTPIYSPPALIFVG